MSRDDGPTPVVRVLSQYSLHHLDAALARAGSKGSSADADRTTVSALSLDNVTTPPDSRSEQTTSHEADMKAVFNEDLESGMQWYSLDYQYQSFLTVAGVT